MNLGATLSDSIALVGALIGDIETAVSAGGGVLAEGVDLVEVVLADAKVKASLSALINDLKA